MFGAKTVALALATMFLYGTAFAFVPPNCRSHVANQPLNPPFASNPIVKPALKYHGSDSTIWSTNGVVIEVSVNGGAKRQFVANGINYEPSLIGQSATAPPYNDFFFTNNISYDNPNLPYGTYNPLWARDIELLRSMGVNSLRVYGTWKWEPEFLQGAAPSTQPSGIGLANLWPELDFSVAPYQANANKTDNAPFCDTSNPNFNTYPHPQHDGFLDLLWNSGKKPIYAWLAIAVPDQTFINGDAKARESLKQFYRYTATWLAQKYGNHPAVIGFVLGNENGNAVLNQTQYWQFVNELNDLIKASAPNKLTIVGFNADTGYNAKITDGAMSGKTGAQVYQADVWGENVYANPAIPNGVFDQFKNFTILNCPSGACIKPLIFSEFGAPADTHKASAALNLAAYPDEVTVLVSKPTALAEDYDLFRTQIDEPVKAVCLPAPPGQPPGSGSLGAAGEFQAQQTAAVLLPQKSAVSYLSGYVYTLPAKLRPFFPDDPGTPLQAAATGAYFERFVQISQEHKASNSLPNRDDSNLLSSGVYAFEWIDEWSKSNHYWEFHGASGEAQNCPAGCTKCISHSPTNVNFPGGWWDEEWFGIAGVKASPRRAPFPQGRPNPHQLKTISVGDDGKISGGPDSLLPRAAIAALCYVYGGCAAP